MSSSAPAFLTVPLGQVPFSVATLNDAVQWTLTAAADKRAVAVRCANAFVVAHASSEPAYRNLISDRGINFADGAPVAWLLAKRSKRVGLTLRVRGPSFFLRVLDLGRPQQLNHYFLGTNDQTLAKLTENLLRRYPGLRVSGMYAPPYAPLSTEYIDDCVDQVAASGADVIWVGLGTPKQDHVADALASRTGTLAVGIGAAFDFAAGTTAEAPLWVQRSGLEWVFRLATEPRRLWRRYLVGNLRFLYAVLGDGRR